jgi:sugar phosphate isomerase/epimerase
MKISFGSWAVSFGPYNVRPVSFQDTAKRLSSAGYDGIEICGFPPHITLEKYPTKESRSEVVSFLKDLKLGISGYAGDFTSVNPTREGSKDRYLDLFRRNVEMCVDLGSPFIRVDTVAAPGSEADEEYQEAFHRVADTWREAAQIGEDAGVLMAWEFEPGFLFNKPSEILEMHQRVAHPNFMLLFDTTHAYMCGVVGARQHGQKDVVVGGVEEFLRKLTGRIGAIHVTDSDGTLYGDETSAHVPFGKGYIDFESLTPKLLRVPRVLWWTIDLCFWPHAWEEIEPSHEFVANLLKNHAALA